MSRRLPPCDRGRRPDGDGVIPIVRFCLCLRCALVRRRALRRAGWAADSLPGATITRAFTENA